MRTHATERDVILESATYPDFESAWRSLFLFCFVFVLFLRGNEVVMISVILLTPLPY